VTALTGPHSLHGLADRPGVKGGVACWTVDTRDAGRYRRLPGEAIRSHEGRPRRLGFDDFGQSNLALTCCLARAVLLGGASRLSGTHLVIPNRSEFDVVTVLSDSQLALGTGAHRGLL